MTRAWRLVIALMCISFSSGTVMAETRMLPVPTTVIASGELVTADKLGDKSFEVPPAAMGRFVLERQQAEGLLARRSLLPGKPIALNYLKRTDMVTQGALTKATLDMEGLSISTYLIPLQSGVAGDVIEARNPEYGTTVHAQVQSNGTLAVTTP